MSDLKNRMCCSPISLLPILIWPFLLCYCSYDNDGTSKDEIKERFSQTMEFVENYLRDVVCQSFPFADKEKNKLTFEVSHVHDYYTLW